MVTASGRDLLAGVLVSAGVGFAGGANASVTFFDFVLSGAQEVPSNTSDSFGFATLEYESMTQTFDITVFTDGIALGDLMGVGPNSSPIHIHMAPAGASGPIVVDLGLVSGFVDEGGGILSFEALGVSIGGPQGAVGTTDAAANEAALFAGDLYLNIHTSSFPGGEIRGQIVPAPAAAGLFGFAGLLATRRRRCVER